MATWAGWLLALCLAQTPLDVSNLFTFWEDKRPHHFPEPLQHMSLVHNPLDICSSPDDRQPQQVESKLECLQAQLSRVESRMASDINLILQLLQRQLSQVPPAYSPISPSSHNLSLYSISLRGMDPASPLEEEELTPTEQQTPSSADTEKAQLKSRDSLSSGVHLTLASDETMTINSEQEHYSQTLPALDPDQRAEGSRGLSQGSRFPSLPEHLEAPSEHLDMQRYLSDPSLPGS